MTTPLAWYASRDRSCLGVVLRDHRAGAFVAVTLREEAGEFVVSREIDALPERTLATTRLVEMVAEVARSWWQQG